MPRINFAVFAASQWVNTWLTEPGIALYVRRTPEPLKFQRGDFQLATLRAHKPGSGALTAFLDRYEPTNQFFIENIMADRLRDFFKRRGYDYAPSRHASEYPYCMIGPEPVRP